MKEIETLSEVQLRYQKAFASVVTGVRLLQQADPTRGTASTLGSLATSTLIQGDALARLLIAKGVMTDVEYFCAMADAMEEEKGRIEQRLQDHWGKPVHLL